MQIDLSWDLFVIVFFTVIIAYTFIIGRNQSIKIIISSYIAILAADGVGNLVERYLLGRPDVAANVGLPEGESTLILAKIIIFILTIVVITTRGKFQINMSRSPSVMVRVILSLAYGILSAGLITSTILIYASGASLVSESSVIINDAVLAIYRESQMVRLMINNYNVWFSLPAMAFVLSSFFGEEEA